MFRKTYSIVDYLRQSNAARGPFPGGTNVGAIFTIRYHLVNQTRTNGRVNILPSPPTIWRAWGRVLPGFSGKRKLARLQHYSLTTTINPPTTLRPGPLESKARKSADACAISGVTTADRA